MKTGRRDVRVFALIQSLVVLGLVGWGVHAGVKWLIGALQTLDSDLAKTLVAASLAVVGSVVSLALSKAYETRSAVQMDLRAKKTPVYEDIVKTLYGVFFSRILGAKDADQKDLMQFFARTTEKLTIWGSDDVLKAYGEWRSQSIKADNPTEGLFMLEGFILKIRKDLGHRNAGLRRGDLLRLFVNDIDNVLAGTAQQAAAADRPSAGS